MKLYPIKFELQDFLKIDEKERAFFVQLGWLCNDLIMFYRLLQGSSNYDKTSEIRIRGNFTQTMSIQRFFASRLYEGWLALESSYFSNISKIYNPELASEGRKELDKLKKFFSTTNYFKGLRDNYGFHTSTDHLIKTMSRLSDTDEPDLIFYLSERNGDSLYWFAEEFLVRGMSNIIEHTKSKSSLKLSYERVFDDCMAISSAFLRFAGYAMTIFINRNFNVKWKVLEKDAIILDDLPALEDLALPFFVQGG